MTSKKRKQIGIGSGLIVLLLLSIPGDGICVPPKRGNPILRSGDLLPSISFPNLMTHEEKKYLGTTEKATLSFGDIPGEVLVIKFLNSNCVYCIKSLPVFNKIFQTIEQDQNLRRQIKIIGIGAGDTPTEVAAFKKQYAIPYPIIPDADFKVHQAVNEPTVPFIVITRRDPQGKWVVATAHVGMTFSSDGFVGELKAILEIDPNTLKKNLKHLFTHGNRF